jgi:3-methyl-2-oxobutanoate hydroxymethyltransferase
MAKLTVAQLQQMKADHQRIVAIVCYDYQMAQILDRAGADVLSVGDSIGQNYWGQASPYQVTVEQMAFACQAVARGAQRAVVNCDLPFGPVQEGPQVAVRAAIELIREGQADMVKMDDSATHMDVVRAIAGAGIPLWCQFGFSRGTSMALGGDFSSRSEKAVVEGRKRIVQEAKDLEAAGASMLDLTNVTPDVYAEAQEAVRIPLLGGQTGPEADGRILIAAHRANFIDRDDLPINTGRYMYEAAVKAFENIKTGNFTASNPMVRPGG